jgi:hypothetical protein
MRAKASTSSSPTMNTSHFGILINGLQSGKTLPSMFLGTCNMLICNSRTLITIWTFARCQRGIPSTLLKCPRSYCTEFVFGGLDENFKGGSEKPAVRTQFPMLSNLA